jgi:hypothetical protein
VDTYCGQQLPFDPPFPSLSKKNPKRTRGRLELDTINEETNKTNSTNKEEKKRQAKRGDWKMRRRKRGSNVVFVK